MHPDVLRVLTTPEETPARASPFTRPRLTPQEKNVLHLIVGEKTTKEIAAALFISENTVESHRKNLMLKLDVRNIAGLVRKTVEWGLLKDPDC